MSEDHMAIVSDSFIDAVESNIHGVFQGMMATLLEVGPDKESQKKYWKKHPDKYYRAVNETGATEQKIKAGGYGNVTTKSLTINMNGLGLNEKQELLGKMINELNAEGEKMGYVKKEVRRLPGAKGVNRVK